MSSVDAKLKKKLVLYEPQSGLGKILLNCWRLTWLDERLNGNPEDFPFAAPADQGTVTMPP